MAELAFRSKRLRFAFEFGVEEGDVEIVSNTDGDFDPVDSDDETVDARFGFRGRR